MIYKLAIEQEIHLLRLPETGMGFQVVEASQYGSYLREKFLVLNSEVVVKINESTSENVRKVINEGVEKFKASAQLIILTAMTVLNEKQFRNIINESANPIERAAIENPVEEANGKEIFTRISAFEDDKRIDKIKLCLREGSYTTTNLDYLKCKETNDDPIERYALPNNDKIQFAFHIQPIKSDTLQRGIVQPANGKIGGGDEAFFAKETAFGTFKQQTFY